MDGGLDAVFGRRPDHRPGDVAPAPDDQIGLHLPQDGAAPGPRAGQVPHGDGIAAQVFQRGPPLEARHLDVMEGIARPGHQAVLHPLFAAGKMDLGGGVGRPQRPRNGKGRVDMAGRTAGSDQYAHG